MLPTFPLRSRFVALATVVLIPFAVPAVAQCPTEPQLQNWAGGGSTFCPCFGAGEQAGAVLNAPAAHYPIEILRVGIGWGSQVGGAEDVVEEAIHIYPAGLPNPGSPLFSLIGPVLADGFINEFDLEPEPGVIQVNSGPFTVALEFANSNAGDPFAPSMVEDGGCQATKNVVFAIPGGWNDACQLGVSGDWVVYAVYRQINCATGVGEPQILASAPMLLAPRPNPSLGLTDLGFVLPQGERVSLVVYDVRGRRVATVADAFFAAGERHVTWDPRAAGLSAGLYIVEMRAGSMRATRKLTLGLR